MVPRTHGEAYADGLPGAAALTLVAGAGHATVLEQPDATALAILALLARREAPLSA
jgi:pimeloyl-ACP methyl ester carboxylesterase